MLCRQFDGCCSRLSGAGTPHTLKRTSDCDEGFHIISKLANERPCFNASIDFLICQLDGTSNILTLAQDIAVRGGASPLTILVATYGPSPLSRPLPPPKRRQEYARLSCHTIVVATYGPPSLSPQYPPLQGIPLSPPSPSPRLLLLVLLLSLTPLTFRVGSRLSHTELMRVAPPLRDPKV